MGNSGGWRVGDSCIYWDPTIGKKYTFVVASAAWTGGGYYTISVRRENSQRLVVIPLISSFYMDQLLKRVGLDALGSLKGKKFKVALSKEQESDYGKACKLAAKKLLDMK